MENKKHFFPNLDGLRFFAFLSIFLAHTFYSTIDSITESDYYKLIRGVAHTGIFGVNFFFVLSGFLISYLLFQEKESTGTIHLKNFFIRRALRILPLYYLIVFTGFVIIPFTQHLLGNTDYVETGNLLSYLFFYNNYTPAPTSAVLGVLWSIAIEEQFYLIWPFILIFTPRKHIGKLCLSIILLSLLARTAWIGYGYLHLFSCISDFAVGGGLAYFTFNKASWIDRIKNTKKVWIILIYVLGACMFLLRHYWKDHYFIYVNERLLFSIFFAFVILEQNEFNNSFYKWGNSKLLSFWGKRTYGLYMYHFIFVYIIFTLLNRFALNTQSYQVFLLEPLLVLSCSLATAYLSFRYFEKPFLKLKREYQQLDPNPEFRK